MENQLKQNKQINKGIIQNKQRIALIKRPKSLFKKSVHACLLKLLLLKNQVQMAHKIRSKENLKVILYRINASNLIFRVDY